MHYYLKKKNIEFIILLSGIFLILCLPNSIKTKFTFNFFGLSFFIVSLVYIPFFIAAIHKVTSNKKNIFFIFFLLINLVNTLAAENYYLQRFFAGLLFLIPIPIIRAIKWDADKFKILKHFLVFTFLFLSFQIILSSLGIVKFNDRQFNSINGYERVSITAGAATFASAVIVIIYGMLSVLVKKKFVNILLFLITIVSVFLSGTRSAMLVLVFAFMLNLVLVLEFKYIIIIILSFLIFIPIVNEKYKVLETIEARNDNAKAHSDGDITSGRVERWGKVFEIFKRTPEVLIAGIGGANSPYYNRFKETNINPIVSPHNVYLGYLLEHGIIGLLFLLGYLFKINYKVLKTKTIGGFIFVFITLVVFNTEVFALGAIFSSIYFLAYTILSKDYENKFF